MQKINNAKIKMRKIKDSTYLCGVLPHASSSPTVWDCTPWTTNRPSACRGVASASHSFASSATAAEAATGPYPTHGC